MPIWWLLLLIKAERVLTNLYFGIIVSPEGVLQFLDPLGLTVDLILPLEHLILKKSQCQNIYLLALPIWGNFIVQLKNAYFKMPSLETSSSQLRQYSLVFSLFRVLPLTLCTKTAVNIFHIPLWACSQRNESRSESRFGSWSASWLGSWFELHVFTCIANAVPITNRICALWGNILFLLRSPRWLTHAWLQRAFPKCTRTNHVPKELCIHMSSESGFLRRSRSKTPLFSRFKSLIWKSFAFTKGKIRLSNQERVRITFRNGFRNVIRSFVNRPSATSIISHITRKLYNGVQNSCTHFNVKSYSHPWCTEEICF